MSITPGERSGLEIQRTSVANATIHHGNERIGLISH